MFDEEFCGQLEYAISGALTKSADIDWRRCWCDGVLLPDNESDYSSKQILKTKNVMTNAWIDEGKTKEGPRGQFLYDMTLAFGKDSLDKLKTGDRLESCIPDSGADSWISSTISPGKMRLRLTIILLTLLSCNDRQKSETKALDFEYFTIDVRVTWEKVKAQGIDSFVGHLTLDNGDTIMFDLGWYSNSLEEEYKFKVENGDVYLKNEKESRLNSTVYEFYGKVDTVDVEQFKVNKIKWTIVDGKRAKVVQPRQTGTGMTGIYFDSLWTAGSETDRFQMNGTNLHPNNEKRLLLAFETLKFKM